MARKKNDKQLKHEKLKDKIEEKHIGLVIEENQKEYSNLVIENRAIPSALDGLKTVHRRILYTFKYDNYVNKQLKTGKIVGSCLGTFHPHGDISIYDALIGMGQPFKNRFPLFEPQGNWGNIEGDSPAAMRYTEVKFPLEYSNFIFDNIDKNGVINWQANYDDTVQEPITLPVKYPIALLNGSSGIAYADITTKIPSYNIRELTNLYIYLIENKFWKKNWNVEKHIKDIMKIIPGVDLPTGTNVYINKEDNQEDMIFKPQFTFRMRANYIIDRKNNTITFYNIPYDISADRIKEQAKKAGISFTLKDRKQVQKQPSEILNISENIDIEVYSTINDNKFKNDAKLTFTFKKGSNLDLELIKVFKYTDLDTSFSAKLIFIDRYGRPKYMSLYDHALQFLYYRAHIFFKAYSYDIKKLEENLHFLYALRKIHDDLDTFIEIVRNNKDEVIYQKVKKIFDLDDKQIEYLLSIQLRKLSKTSLQKLKEDIKEKEKKVKLYKKIISSKDNLFKVILDDYKNLLEKNILNSKKTKRFTKFIKATKEIDKEDLIENKEIILMYMEDDTIAYIDKSKIRLKKRGTKTTNNKINSDFELKLKISENCNLKDDVLLMTNKGRIFKIKAYNFGDSFKFIGNFINITKDEEIINILKYDKKDKFYLIATKNGKIKGLRGSMLSNITSNRGITAIKLEDKDEVVTFIPYTKNENEMVITTTTTGKVLKYLSKEVSVLTGGNTKGIKNINLNEKDKEEVLSVKVYEENINTVLIGISDIAKAKKTLTKNIPLKKRSGASILFFNNSNENGKLISADIFKDMDKEILMLLNEKGDISLLKIKNFNTVSRTAKGAIKLLNLQPGEKIKICKKVFIEELTPTQTEILKEEF